MCHTVLQCFWLARVNECAAYIADSHACLWDESPLMSCSGIGEWHDGSDGWHRAVCVCGGGGPFSGRDRTIWKLHGGGVHFFYQPSLSCSATALSFTVFFPRSLSFPLHRSVHNFTSTPQHSLALSRPPLPPPPWHNAGIIRDLMEVVIFCRAGDNNGNKQYPPLPPPSFFSYSASIHFPFIRLFFYNLVAFSCCSDSGAERCEHLAPGRSSCLIYGDIGLGSRVCVHLHVLTREALSLPGRCRGGCVLRHVGKNKHKWAHTQCCFSSFFFEWLAESSFFVVVGAFRFLAERRDSSLMKNKQKKMKG